MSSLMLAISLSVSVSVKLPQAASFLPSSSGMPCSLAPISVASSRWASTQAVASVLTRCTRATASGCASAKALETPITSTGLTRPSAVAITVAPAASALIFRLAAKQRRVGLAGDEGGLRLGQVHADELDVGKAHALGGERRRQELMKDGAARADHLLALQLFDGLRAAGLAEDGEGLGRAADAGGDQHWVAAGIGEQHRGGVHDAADVERAGGHRLGLLGAGGDVVPVDLDAVGGELLLQELLLAHDDGLQVEGRLHVGDVDFLQRLGGEGWCRPKGRPWPRRRAERTSDLSMSVVLLSG